MIDSITFKITEADLEAGTREHLTDCPIGLAVERAYPGRRRLVGLATISLRTADGQSRDTYEMPSILIMAREEYDRFGPQAGAGLLDTWTCFAAPSEDDAVE